MAKNGQGMAIYESKNSRLFFQNWKKRQNVFYIFAFDHLKFRYFKHLKMTVSASVLWKKLMQLAKNDQK